MPQTTPNHTKLLDFDLSNGNKCILVQEDSFIKDNSF